MDLQKEYQDAGQSAQGTPSDGSLQSEYDSAAPGQEQESSEPPEFEAVKSSMDMATVSQMVAKKDYEGIGKYVAGLFTSVEQQEQQQENG